MSRYIPPAVSPGLGTLVGVRPGDYDENIFFNKSITLIVIKITVHVNSSIDSSLVNRRKNVAHSSIKSNAEVEAPG